MVGLLINKYRAHEGEHVACDFLRNRMCERKVMYLTKDFFGPSLQVLSVIWATY